VQSYVKELGGDIVITPSDPCEVIVRVHESDEIPEDFSIGKDVVIFDPWRSYESVIYKVIHYGNTR
jgi:hypothetical protein